MAKEKPECNKLHVSIGTIGHVDHDKTALTAAPIKVCSDTWGGSARAFDQVDNAPEEKARGITISTSHVEYDSAVHHYVHVGCPGHADYTRNMIAGTTQMDGAILTCSAANGPMPQTREYIPLPRQIGISYIIVSLNRADMIDDTELLELVEMEVCDLLNAYGFPDNDTPIIIGSALMAPGGKDDSGIGVSAVQKLVETSDSYIPGPVRVTNQPFLMSVEDVFSTSGRGTVVTGRVKHGIIKVQEEVETVDIKATTKTTYTGVEMFCKLLNEGHAGGNVGILLHGTKHEGIECGQAPAKPDITRPHTKFECEVYVLPRGEGGRHTSFFKGYRPQLYFRTTDVTGNCELPEGVKMIMSNDDIKMAVTLIAPIATGDGLRLAIREGGHTVSADVVAKTIE